MVPARGGQAEIVSHGESGYLWTTVDDLIELTAALMASPGDRARMAHRARARAGDFSRARFAERCLTLLE